MSTVSVVTGRVRPANGGAPSRRAIVCASASSHASPLRTWMGQTMSARLTSWASSTALSSPPEKSTAASAMRVGVGYSESMYLVTKRIDFCYGHRLLDYGGICKHPHGHNAVVEV